MKRNLNRFFFFFFLIFFIYFSFIYAKEIEPIFIPREPTRITSQIPIIGSYTFEIGFPGIAPAGETMYFPKGMDPFAYIIAAFVNLVLRLSGIVLFIILVYSGIMYSLSGGDPKKKQEAQKRIIEAIIGFFLLFGFYIILNTINPEILKQKSTNLPILISPHPEPVPEQPPGEAPPSIPAPLPENYIDIKKIGLPLDPTLNQYESVYLDKDLAEKLAEFYKNKTTSFIITDACVKINADGTCETTTSRPQENSCHRYGKCVDIDNSGINFEELKNLLVNAGFAVLDEKNHLHTTTPDITSPTYWGGVDYSDCKSQVPGSLCDGGICQWYVANRCPKPK